MTAPGKLAAETKSTFARALLRSAATDAPKDGGADRALAALGLGAATSVGPASGIGASSGSQASGVPSIAAPAGAKGALAIVKWIAAGAMVSGAALSVWHAEKRTSVAPSVPVAVAPAASAPAPVVVSAPTALPAEADDRLPVAPPPPPPAARQASRPRAASPAVPSAAPPPAPPAPPNVSASSLAAEMTALDSVRDAIARGRGAEALGMLDAFDARYPNAVLREETLVLRIEALAATGQRSAADERARAFLRDHPGSAYAQRVRSSLRAAP